MLLIKYDRFTLLLRGTVQPLLCLLAECLWLNGNCTSSKGEDSAANTFLKPRIQHCVYTMPLCINFYIQSNLGFRHAHLYWIPTTISQEAIREITTNKETQYSAKAVKSYGIQSREY